MEDFFLKLKELTDSLNQVLANQSLILKRLEKLEGENKVTQTSSENIRIGSTAREERVVAASGVVPRILDTSGMVEFTDEFYRLVDSKSEILLESGKTYRVHTIKQKKVNKKIDFKTTGSERANLLFGVENYKPWEGNESWALFKIQNGAEFISKNINWCLVPQLVTPQRYIPNFFTSDRNPNAVYTAIIQDCDTTALGRNGGFGIGLIHGSVEQNHIALINFKHAGGRLMDLKNPDPKSVLYLTMKDVDTDYLNPDEFNPHYLECKVRFTPDFGGFKINGFYGSHCAEIQDPFSFFPITNQFYARGYNNRLIMIHIDRFVFWLPSTQFLEKMVDPILLNVTQWKPNDESTLANIGAKVLLNQVARKGDMMDLVRDYWFDESGNKIPAKNRKNEFAKNQIRSFPNRLLDSVSNYPVELQPGDILNINGIEYKIEVKERGNNWHIENEWRQVSKQEAQYIYSVLTLDKNLPEGLDSFKAEVIFSSAEYLLDGQYREAIIVSKGNSQIDLREESKYQDDQVMKRQNAPYHLSYNHGGEKGISIWAENANHFGFYRQSGNGGGISLGYNMINCKGFENEFRPYQLTINKPMPDRISKSLSI